MTMGGMGFIPERLLMMMMIHTIITTDHGCQHPNLLTDSQAVIVCCTMQVSYGLFEKM